MNSCVEGSNPSFSVSTRAAAPSKCFAGGTSRFPQTPSTGPLRGRALRAGSNPSFSVEALVRRLVARRGRPYGGCGGDGGADASQLEDTPWVLSSGTGITLPASVAPSALFSAGQVSGSTSCNQYSGPYELDGDSLNIGQLAMTLIACVPPRDAIEREYVRALGLVAGWAVDGEESHIVRRRRGRVAPLRSGIDSRRMERHRDPLGRRVLEPDRGHGAHRDLRGRWEACGVSGLQQLHDVVHVGEGHDRDRARRLDEEVLSRAPGRHGPEAAFLSALAEAATFRIDATTADLLNAEGQRLVGFERR